MNPSEALRVVGGVPFAMKSDTIDEKVMHRHLPKPAVIILLAALGLESDYGGGKRLTLQRLFFVG